MISTVSTHAGWSRFRSALFAVFALVMLVGLLPLTSPDLLPAANAAAGDKTLKRPGLDLTAQAQRETGNDTAAAEMGTTPCTNCVRRAVDPPAASLAPQQEMSIFYGSTNCAGGSNEINECTVIRGSGRYGFSGTPSDRPDSNFWSPFPGGLCSGTVTIGYDNDGATAINRPYSGLSWNFEGVRLIRREWRTDPINGWIFVDNGANGIRDTDANAQPGGTDDIWRWGEVGRSAPYLFELSRQYITNYTNYTCLLPALFRETFFRCPYRVEVAVEGPFDNPIVPTATQYQTRYTPWGRTYNSGTSLYTDGSAVTGPAGYHVGDLRLCNDTRAIESAERYDWGRYREEGQIFYRECRVWEYFRADQATGNLPTHVSRQVCGEDLTNYEEGQYFFTMLCLNQNRILHRFEDGDSGWQTAQPMPNGTAGVTFTSADCQPPNITAEDRIDWNAFCPRPTYPSLNGVVARDFTVLGDGKTNTAEWVVPTPTGASVDLSTVTNTESRWMVDRMSSPWRGETPEKSGYESGTDVNAPNQFFDGSKDFIRATNSGLGGWSSDIQPSIDLQWFRAGFIAENGAAVGWTMYPEWAWDDATLTGRAEVGEKWNWVTGTASYGSLQTVTMPNVRLVCTGEPLDVTVKRPRLTSSQ